MRYAHDIWSIRLLAITIATLCFCAAPSFTADPTANLLTNPGFEQKRDGQPAGWEASSPQKLGASEGAIDTTVARSGQSSLRLVREDPEGWAFWSQGPLKVQAGAVYDLGGTEHLLTGLRFYERYTDDQGTLRACARPASQVRKQLTRCGRLEIPGATIFAGNYLSDEIVKTLGDQLWNRPTTPHFRTDSWRRWPKATPESMVLSD